MTADGPSAEIWFVTGSQGLYGTEVLDQVAEQSRTVATTLQASNLLPVPVVWQPVVTDSAAVERLARAADASPTCIGIIAWRHTFSPARMWIAGGREDPVRLVFDAATTRRSLRHELRRAEGHYRSAARR